jgi:putative methionine-R-sulfoxide reductase with GAF domain
MVQKKVADLLLEQFDLYYVGVFLIDQTGEYAVLHYGTGDAGRQMLSSSYRLAVGGYSLVGKSIQTNQSKTISAEDPDVALFENPFLPDSRCELAIPLSNGVGIFGVLNIHSTNTKKFNENTRMILQEAADLLALALDKNSAFSRPNESQRFGQKYASLDAQNAAFEIKEIEFSYVNPLFTPSETETTKVQVPLTLRNETIGSIDLEITGKELTQEQTELLQTVSAQTIIALENASLLDHSMRHADRERKVLEITSRIRSTNDSKQMLQITLEELSRSLGVSKAQIVLNVPERPQEEDNSDTESDTKSLNRKLTTGELREP